MAYFCPDLKSICLHSMKHPMRWLILSASFLLLSPALWSQNEKIIHQTFDLSGIQELTLDLVGEVEIEFWAGDNILSETNIQLYDAAPHVLDFFIKEKKRYEILELREEERLALRSADPLRDPIQYRGATCFEVTHLRVFVPDSFEKTGEGAYRRKQ